MGTYEAIVVSIVVAAIGVCCLAVYDLEVLPHPCRYNCSSAAGIGRHCVENQRQLLVWSEKWERRTIIGECVIDWLPRESVRDWFK